MISDDARLLTPLQRDPMKHFDTVCNGMEIQTSEIVLPKAEEFLEAYVALGVEPKNYCGHYFWQYMRDLSSAYGVFSQVTDRFFAETGINSDRLSYWCKEPPKPAVTHAYALLLVTYTKKALAELGLRKKEFVAAGNNMLVAGLVDGDLLYRQLQYFKSYRELPMPLRRTIRDHKLATPMAILKLPRAEFSELSGIGRVYLQKVEQWFATEPEFEKKLVLGMFAT